MINGITPAYAGNTRREQLQGLASEDHPRIRGEYAPFLVACSRQLGSPPHTRGIQDFTALIVLLPRITPAYAGNTQCRLAVQNDPGDHPRIRGEYFTTPEITPLIPGSPPHTRGILPPFSSCPAAFRITPAYAGNTNHHTIQRNITRDHPRIRGEYLQTSG